MAVVPPPDLACVVAVALAAPHRANPAWHAPRLAFAHVLVCWSMRAHTPEPVVQSVHTDLLTVWVVACTVDGCSVDTRVVAVVVARLPVDVGAAADDVFAIVFFFVAVVAFVVLFSIVAVVAGAVVDLVLFFVAVAAAAAVTTVIVVVTAAGVVVIGVAAAPHRANPASHAPRSAFAHVFACWTVRAHTPEPVVQSVHIDLLTGVVDATAVFAAAARVELARDTSFAAVAGGLVEECAAGVVATAAAAVAVVVLAVIVVLADVAVFLPVLVASTDVAAEATAAGVLFPTAAVVPAVVGTAAVTAVLAVARVLLRSLLLVEMVLLAATPAAVAVAVGDVVVTAVVSAAAVDRTVPAGDAAVMVAAPLWCWHLLADWFRTASAHRPASPSSFSHAHASGSCAWQQEVLLW